MQIEIQDVKIQNNNQNIDNHRKNDLNTIIKLNKKFGYENFDLLNNSLKILDYVYKNFSCIKIASSFGLEDVVVIDLACKIVERPIVFFLDTGRLHGETYQTVEKIRKRYNINLEIYYPNASDVEKLVKEKGLFSFYESIENRKECCYIRKVKPLLRALQNVEGWITGLRRGQAQTRTNVMPFELDIDHNNILKINPLFNWGLNGIWTYIKMYDIPYNPLHDRGFPSIGCEPCTRAIKPGEDIRAGRWWWESPEHKECGLHKK
jgi:phosphoadenosine phosphosulfate reductase